MNEKIKFSKNCFDPIRLWAALSVMFLHYTGYALKLSSSGNDFMYILRCIVSFFPGVVVLFSMSGYLISASFERSKSKKEFFVKRVFRLYPELWGCTLINVIVVSVLAREQLDKSIVVWLITQVFGIANTPSCLSNFATGSINGALWTIFTEIQLYIVLGIIYPFLKKFSIKKWGLLIGIMACINVVCGFLSKENNGMISKMIERLFIPYAVWFFIGVFCYVKRNIVLPYLKKRIVLIIIVYFLIQLFCNNIPGYYANIVVGILCPLIVVGGAYTLPAVRISYDITYGMFLYHWIILNIIVHFDLMNKLPWFLTIGIFTFSTIIFAYLSQKIVGNKSKVMINKLLRS